MAEEAQGQAATPQPLPDNINEFEAVGILTQAIEADEAPEKPRDEKGKFKKQEAPEAQTEEAKPAEEAPEEKAEEPAPEEEQPEIQPEPRRFKLKYKGEEREVDEPEITELAQKGYDYTQKMQALSKEREEAAAKVKVEQEAARKIYESQLETYKKAVQQISGVKSMQEIEALSRQDPAVAQQEFLRSLSVNQVLAAIETEQAKLAQQKEIEAREGYQKQAKEAVERLQERIPNWNDDLYGKILKHAVDNYGFQKHEVNAITDHRAIEVLNKARMWDEYQAAPKKVSEKKVPPVAPKVQKPGSAEAKPKADKVTASMAKLKETGSRQAAEEYAQALLESGRL